MKTKTRYVDYLYSHIEWEHAAADSFEMFQTEILDNLSVEQLEYLARLYGYDKK